MIVLRTSELKEWTYLFGQSVDDVEQLDLVGGVLGEVEEEVGPQPDLGVAQMEDVAHLHHGHGVLEAALVLGRLAYSHGGFYKMKTIQFCDRYFFSIYFVSSKIFSTLIWAILYNNTSTYKVTKINIHI